MLDAPFRHHFGDPLEAAGRLLAARGVRANALTAIGAALAVLAAACIASGSFHWALVPLLLSRLADGLDGPVARARGESSDFGGFLDTVADYLFYAIVPLAFAVANPEQNAVWAALLLATFAGTGSSFLAFAAAAKERGLKTDAQGEKSIYYAAGLAEGTETILFFVAFCLWPSHFPVLAGLFAALCVATVVGRVALARRLLAPPPEAARADGGPDGPPPAD